MAEHPDFLWKDLFRFRKSEKQSLIDVLKENILFCTLNARELRYLARFVYERTYQPGESIFKQGDRGFGMYIIVRGRVAIKTAAPDREVLHTTLEPGSFFGELSLIESENLRTASADAVDRTVIISFFKPDLIEIVERKPQMAVKVLLQLSKVLGRRLSETTDKITQLTFMAKHGPRKSEPETRS